MLCPQKAVAFSKIFGEPEHISSYNVGADVGIGPYSQAGRCIRIRGKSPCMCSISRRADRVVRPYETGAYRSQTVP